LGVESEKKAGQVSLIAARANLFGGRKAGGAETESWKMEGLSKNGCRLMAGERMK
jgi:hypothetical protein